VDNILRGGASFEIREIFVGLIKLLTYTALSILLLQEEKNFLGENFKESFHTSISLSKILFRKLC